MLSVIHKFSLQGFSEMKDKSKRRKLLIYEQAKEWNYLIKMNKWIEGDSIKVIDPDVQCEQLYKG